MGVKLLFCIDDRRLARVDGHPLWSWGGGGVRIGTYRDVPGTSRNVPQSSPHMVGPPTPRARVPIQRTVRGYPPATSSELFTPFQPSIDFP